MRVTIRLFLFCLIALIVAPSIGLAEGGNIARVSYWTIKAGSEEQFEAGIKAHNQVHADHNDPHGIFTGMIISGKRQGEVLRGSLGHKWADFDSSGAVPADVDQADMAANLDPYIESRRVVYYEHHPEISNPAAAPMPMASATYFYLKPGKSRSFRAAVAKVHEAIGEIWTAYDWYSVADGGRQPTWVVVAPRADWAALDEDRNDEFEAAMMETHGEEWGAIFDDFFAAVEGQYSHSMVFPADLNYVPATETE